MRYTRAGLLNCFAKFQGVAIDKIFAIACESVHVDKNATLAQCIEQRLTTKYCMSAEMSPQNLLLLAKSNPGYVLSLSVYYSQDFSKDRDVGEGQHTVQCMRGKVANVKSGQSNWELAT